MSMPNEAGHSSPIGRHTPAPYSRAHQWQWRAWLSKTKNKFDFNFKEHELITWCDARWSTLIANNIFKTFGTTQRRWCRCWWWCWFRLQKNNNNNKKIELYTIDIWFTVGWGVGCGVGDGVGSGVGSGVGAGAANDELHVNKCWSTMEWK